MLQELARKKQIMYLNPDVLQNAVGNNIWAKMLE